MRPAITLGAVAIFLLAVALQMATSLSDPNESQPDEPAGVQKSSQAVRSVFLL